MEGKNTRQGCGFIEDHVWMNRELNEGFIIRLTAQDGHFSYIEHKAKVRELVVPLNVMQLLDHLPGTEKRGAERKPVGE